MLFEVTAERFDCAKRLGAHMVFHALDVVGDDGFSEAKLAEKTGEEFVPMGDAAGHFFARARQNHAAIFFVFYEAFGIEPLDHGGDTGLGNFELSRDIDNAGIAFSLNELADAFEVVLDGSGRARKRGRNVVGHVGEEKITPSL